MGIALVSGGGFAFAKKPSPPVAPPLEPLKADPEPTGLEALDQWLDHRRIDEQTNNESNTIIATNSSQFAYCQRDADEGGRRSCVNTQFAEGWNTLGSGERVTMSLLTQAIHVMPAAAEKNPSRPRL